MRHYLSIADMTTEEMTRLFDLADRISASHLTDVDSIANTVRDFTPRLSPAAEPPYTGPANKIMALAFFEPSTRTHLSFTSAMLRLGGKTLGFSGTGGTSVAKGETLADTVRMLSAYADVLAMRNPLDGSARLASEYAWIPVINGGDGAHEHPTQALMDLFTIRKEKGQIAGLTVGLVGDLLYGRTAHSLAPGLAAFGAKLVFVAPQSLQMPDYVTAKVEQTMGGVSATAETLAEVVKNLDLIYMTRVQRERFPSPEAYEAVREAYRLDRALMSAAKPDCLVLHPLPRVTEIDPRVDADPRALYFRQAAYGVPVRMALIATLLAYAVGRARRESPETVERGADQRLCANERCVLNHERHVPLAAVEQQGERCVYCEQLRRS